MWELRKIAKALGLFIGIVFILEVIRRLHNRLPCYLRVIYLPVVSLILAQPLMLVTTLYQKYITDPALISFLSSIHFHIILYLISLLFFATLTYLFLTLYIHKVNALMNRAGRISHYPRKAFAWLKTLRRKVDNEK